VTEGLHTAYSGGSAIAGSLPADVASFDTAFARAVLRHLATHGPSTTTAIARVLETDANTVRRRLLQMEVAGIVAADTPPGQRSGRRVRYAVDTERVRALLTALGDYLLGE